MEPFSKHGLATATLDVDYGLDLAIYPGLIKPNPPKVMVIQTPLTGRRGIQQLNAVFVIQKYYADIFFREITQWMEENGLVMDPWAALAAAKANPLHLGPLHPGQRYTAMYRAINGQIWYLQSGGDLVDKVHMSGGESEGIDESTYFSGGCENIFVAVPVE